MMTDREMIALAAKAAGIDPDWAGPHTPRDWNPLKDDGDAFRLAVKLGFRVYIYPGAGDDFTVVGGDDELPHKVAVSERHNGDAFAATRLAIVRAAAEIGKAMK